MADAETMFDLLQMEIVKFTHSSKNIGKNEANTKLEQMGYRVGQSLVEKLTKDAARFNNELDMMKFICKDFWIMVYGKQIDNLRTNHQGVYVLNDNSFKLLNRITTNRQFVSECQKYVAFPCGLVRGALAGVGVSSFVSADIKEMPLVKFQVEIQR
ncbi:trafficking protein particle complex subunit 6b-like [Clytia hemisphaerica]